jgi:hypothetical protein
MHSGGITPDETQNFFQRLVRRRSAQREQAA